MEYKLHNGSGSLCCKGCSRQDKKLNTYDWLADIPGNTEESDMVEVQFKIPAKGIIATAIKSNWKRETLLPLKLPPDMTLA